MIKIRFYNLMDRLKRYIYSLGFSFKKKDREEDMLDIIKKAQEELESKEKYFDHAIDPDLVDFAIYDMEASKRKYSYLLKKIKKENNM